MEQSRIKALLSECCTSPQQRSEILHELALCAGVEQEFNDTKGHWAPSTRIGGAWSLFSHLFEQAAKADPPTFESLFPPAAALCGNEVPREAFAQVDWTLHSHSTTMPLSSLTGTRLKKELALNFNPKVLLLSVENERFEISARTCGMLKSAGLLVVGEVVLSAEEKIFRTKKAGVKTRRELLSALAELHLDTNTPLPEKVIAWFKTHR